MTNKSSAVIWIILLVVAGIFLYKTNPGLFTISGTEVSFGDGSDGSLIFTSAQKSFGSMLNGPDYSVSGNTLYLKLNREYNFDNFIIGSGMTVSTLDTTGSVLCIAAKNSQIDGAINVAGTLNFASNSFTCFGKSFTNQITGNGGAGGNSGGGGVGPGGTGTIGYGGGGGGGGSSTTCDGIYHANVGGTGASGSSPAGSLVPGANCGNLDPVLNNYAFSQINGVSGNSGSSGGSGSATCYVYNNGVTGSYIHGSAGGTGAAGYSHNGGDFNSGDYSGNHKGIALGGGGGSGGNSGKSGANIYLQASNLTLTGSLMTSGENGFNGGNGGAGMTHLVGCSGFAGSGGGGGGGGGGSAGNVYIDYTTLIGSGSIIMNAGSGGIGGNGGASDYGAVVGYSGNSGSSGFAGTLVKNKITVLYAPLQLGPNQLVAMETFSGGATISKTSFRYPVVAFSPSVLPVIVIDSANNTVSRDSVIYGELDAGQTLQVPPNQVWSLFYVLDNNYQLPTVCSVLDLRTNTCAQINPGIVTVCSQGQFDPSLGICVVQPESQVICPNGGRYDVSQNVCIFNPPLQAVCPAGSIYNVNTQLCEFTPASANVCPTGYTYNSGTNKCEIYPISQIICPGGYAYDSASAMCTKYPDSRTICGSGSIYNNATGYCEFTPASANVCPTGYTYNSGTNKCEYKPATDILCGSGATYDLASNTCILTPPINRVCTQGALTNLGNGNYACVYSPTAVPNCPQGSTYNSATDRCDYVPQNAYVCNSGFTYNAQTGRCEVPVQISCIQGTFDSLRNACVYSPNLQYLCTEGTLKQGASGPYCEINPKSTIVCAQGFYYDKSSDKCTKYPDYLSQQAQASAIPGITANLSMFTIVVAIVIIIFLLVAFGRKR